MQPVQGRGGALEEAGAVAGRSAESRTAVTLQKHAGCLPGGTLGEDESCFAEAGAVGSAAGRQWAADAGAGIVRGRRAAGAGLLCRTIAQSQQRPERTADRKDADGGEQHETTGGALTPAAAIGGRAV